MIRRVNSRTPQRERKHPYCTVHLYPDTWEALVRLKGLLDLVDPKTRGHSMDEVVKFLLMLLEQRGVRVFIGKTEVPLFGKRSLEEIIDELRAV